MSAISRALRLPAFLGKPITTGWILVLLALEALLCFTIIRKVPYTEIDWEAYMSQVKGFLQGERNYLNLRGGTGPLVYPAFFLYVYTALFNLTEQGQNILTGQYIFAALYMLNAAVVFYIYKKSKAPLWAAALLCLSKRVHSIYLLRLFNDGFAALLAHLAVAFGLKGSWPLACTFLSLGVGMKMNVLLYAPAVLLLMLRDMPPLYALTGVAWCGVIQIIIGFPFLSTFPLQYLSKAFELSRVFMYKWTVNLKFLDEETFLWKSLSIALFALHVILLLFFIRGVLKTSLWDKLQLKRISKSKGTKGEVEIDSSGDRVWVLFMANFIGVACARTLHYQFYSWYFYSLPLLFWKSNFPAPVAVALLLAVEVSFNVFPAQGWSSLLLQMSHVVLMVASFARFQSFESNPKAKKS